MFFMFIVNSKYAENIQLKDKMLNNDPKISRRKRNKILVDKGIEFTIKFCIN